MSWTYRVIRAVEMGEPFYAIYEVYDSPEGITESPSWPSGASTTELAVDLAMMQRALSLPTLEYVDGQLREVDAVIQARERQQGIKARIERR